jgi:hypothetical protein
MFRKLIAFNQKQDNINLMKMKIFLILTKNLSLSPNVRFSKFINEKINLKINKILFSNKLLTYSLINFIIYSLMNLIILFLLVNKR